MCINLYINVQPKSEKKCKNPSPLSAAALQGARSRLGFRFLDALVQDESPWTLHFGPKAQSIYKRPAKICEQKTSPAQGDLILAYTLFHWPGESPRAAR